MKSNRKARPKDGQQNQPAKRRLIAEAEKVQWAIERYAPLRDGKRLVPVMDIAKRYGRHPIVVTRGIHEAFREGWVELMERPLPITSVTHDLTLEKELEKRYGLQKAIVVKVEDLAALEPSRQTDAAHRRAGQAFARFLSGSVGFFRASDVIGFGSGRGVYFCMDSLLHLNSQFPATGITVASVTGTLHARDHTGELAAVCDGDFHTNLGAIIFGGKPCQKIRLMNTKLACSPEQRELEFSQTWLGGPEWDNSPVSHLICGTGILVKGHRLHLSATPGTKEAALEENGLEPIVGQLRELSRLADEVTRSHPEYYPVGDICNFLFYIENAAVTTHKKKILDLVIEVNKCLLNLQENQLFEIGTIMLIASSKKKQRAISQLLTQDPFRRGGTESRKLNIQYVCVDDETAACLCRY